MSMMKNVNIIHLPWRVFFIAPRVFFLAYAFAKCFIPLKKKFSVLHSFFLLLLLFLMSVKLCASLLVTSMIITKNYSSRLLWSLPVPSADRTSWCKIETLSQSRNFVPSFLGPWVLNYRIVVSFDHHSFFPALLLLL